MRISDWSSDVCSSDLARRAGGVRQVEESLAAVAQRRPIEEGHVAHDPRALAVEEVGVERVGDRKIGRESWRESGSVRVDVGGRRILKQKHKMQHSSIQETQNR